MDYMQWNATYFTPLSQLMFTTCESGLRICHSFMTWVRCTKKVFEGYFSILVPVSRCLHFICSGLANGEFRPVMHLAKKIQLQFILNQNRSFVILYSSLRIFWKWFGERMGRDTVHPPHTPPTPLLLVNLAAVRHYSQCNLGQHLSWQFQLGIHGNSKSHLKIKGVVIRKQHTHSVWGTGTIDANHC